MIDYHRFIEEAVAPVKVKPSSAYIPKCQTSTCDSEFEVADTDKIIALSGQGTGVLLNSGEKRVYLFHIGKALVNGARKINNLPSACDLILTTENELILAELTESNSRSILGVEGGSNPGKMEKAYNQLKSTIALG